ncbi:hypothetical protein E5P55_00305 [Candidatus Pinguicoccus supinus]|uniref:Uncharacterized protein n=1 Tax=Candidatus Pinguicoccus supinus TaxID=2529394 RepID=A0A7T0BRP6_9BACT|nr:hypothetical protein E5P55_00305 [Candidatus Pinguicoccus supinus]
MKTTVDTLNLFFEKLNLNEKVYRINPKKNFSKWYLFKKAYIFLTDDLNTNSCIYEIINIIKKINITGLSFTKKKHLQTSFRQLMFLLGLEKCFIFKKKNIRKCVINFIIKRWQLKKKFNYFRSDSLRKKLLMLG